jgi:hypothetical protein
MRSNRPEHLDPDPYDRLLGANVLLREQPYEEDEDDEEDEDNGKKKEKDVEDDEEGGYSVFPVSSSFVRCEILNDAWCHSACGEIRHSPSWASKASTL